MPDLELEADYRKSQERRKRFREDWERSLVDPDNKSKHPRPWTGCVVIHDGPGVQFIDANGNPVLGPDLMRDTDDAATILHAINGCT